jgi:DNA-binding transcriptional LysR family regulator
MNRIATTGAAQFHGLDLNLLRVFDILIEERSATRAGERLGLSQSAISHALNRLRYVLGDELFVRGPDGMQPTARATAIAPRLRSGLAQLQLALAPSEFVPQQTDRRFTIVCGEYVGTVLVPLLVARLRREAPHAELRIRPSNTGVAEALLAGRADLAIGSFRRIPEWFAHEGLFRETRVWVLGADNPAAWDELTLDQLAALPHVIISATGEDEQAVGGYVVDHGLERLVMRSEVGLLQGALAARGLRRSIGLTTPHFLAALAILGHSDMTAPLPRRLATALAGAYHLKLFEPPYPSPPFEIMALWHRAHGGDPAVVWLRAVLREVAAGL